MTHEQKARLSKVISKWIDDECSRDETVFTFYVHSDTHERIAEIVASVVDFAATGNEEP